MVVDIYTKSLKRIKEEGGKVIFGGKVLEREGFYV
jgi:hypothetical protein